jgi:hypothetical protein
MDNVTICQLQWPRGLRQEISSSPAQTLGWCIRIPLDTRMSAFMLRLCSTVQAGTLRKSNPPSKESYRISVWLSSHLIEIYFKLQIGFYSVVVSLRQNTTQMHISNKQYKCHTHTPITHITQNNTTKTLWPLVRKRTIPTERQPFVDEI